MDQERVVLEWQKSDPIDPSKQTKEFRERAERILTMKIEEMPGYAFDCVCGRHHQIDMKHLLSGSGALERLPEIINTFPEQKKQTILLLCDCNTWEAAGRKTDEILRTAGFRTKVVELSTKNYPVLIPDEAALGTVLVNLTDDIGFLVGVGSGTISDITKLVSYKTGRDSIVVGTAPSMDGYASLNAAFVIDGHKITYPAHYHSCIVADTKIMKDAPMELMRAGYGDIVGKYTALSDWRLTKAVNDEHYCEITARLVENAVDLCVANTERYFLREEAAVEHMNEALILTGISMGITGYTRPASGSEHHLAHYWELDAIEKGISHPLHGNSVGLASIASAEVYDIMSRRFEIVAEVHPPKPDFLREIYAKAGCALTPTELGISDEVFLQSLKNGYKIRPRYTIFNFTRDQGMLEEVAAEVAGRMGRKSI
jgi:sn-glycerol-1-phosphate dehydrogenase